MEKKKLSLPAQIFIALLLGIVVGLAFYFTGVSPSITTNYLKPFGDHLRQPPQVHRCSRCPAVHDRRHRLHGRHEEGRLRRLEDRGVFPRHHCRGLRDRPCVLATVFNNAGLFPNLQLVGGSGLRSTRPRHAPASWRPWSASSPVTCGRRLPHSQHASGHRHRPAVSAAPFWLPVEKAKLVAGHGDLRLYRGHRAA